MPILLVVILSNLGTNNGLEECTLYKSSKHQAIANRLRIFNYYESTDQENPLEDTNNCNF